MTLWFFHSGFNYQAYLKSDEWKARRERALTISHHACQICNSPSHLQVHHRSYERIGREVDSDLIVLCSKCHTVFHEAGRMPTPPEPKVVDAAKKRSDWLKAVATVRAARERRKRTTR